ncbi:hypothetical protein [Ornithinibacillus halophilus]|uniref:Uncharacterized protein n=1 Tax=Ornithinibacillus halophilus TaxID=930117 RepID=A0A1M5J5D9_9BACI|nr:hypothetical protein [Ornithinibacillus halophilus]SHG35796.1 hypothetical protein SAMN05216225_102817 [Ornithinibacillus halophilus]
MLRKWTSVLLILVVFLPLGSSFAEEVNDESQANKHNWQVYSTDYEEIDVGTHEYTYWKNFIRQKRTCQISHRIKTTVYYCDAHDHTRSETHLEEIIHSERHKDN